MERTRSKPRAWIPATVATVSVVALLIGCSLLRKLLDDREIGALDDLGSPLWTFLYGPMAPLDATGFGGRSFSDHAVEHAAGLVPVIILVFLFTWISARTSRGAAAPVLTGAWLGTTLGTALGAWVALEVLLSDLTASLGPGFAQMRYSAIVGGLYWGAALGLLVGLLALVTWLLARRVRADEPGAYRVTESQPTSYPPPTGEPAGAPYAAPPAPAPASEERPAPPPPPPGTEERPAPTATAPRPPDETTRG